MDNKWIPDPDLGQWRHVPPLGAIRLERRSQPEPLADYRVQLRVDGGREETVRTTRGRDDAGAVYWSLVDGCNAAMLAGWQPKARASRFEIREITNTYGCDRANAEAFLALPVAVRKRVVARFEAWRAQVGYPPRTSPLARGKFAELIDEAGIDEAGP